MVAISTVAAAPDTAAPPLRLEDAIHLALAGNERARIADAEVTVSSAGVQRARAGFLPVLAAGGNRTQHADAPPARTGTQPGASGVGTGFVQFTEPLINAPAWPLYRQAKQLLEAQRYQSTEEKRLLAFDAARSFLSALTSEGVLRAAETRLAGAQANLADAQARADAELASSNDVTRAKVDLSGAAREVEADRGSLESAYVSLALVLASPQPSSLERPEALLATARKPVEPIDSLVRVAMANRPDLAASRHAALAAHDFAAEPLMRFAPTLGLTGQLNLSTGQTVSGTSHDESLSLTLGWTLFDAGVRNADRKARVAQAMIADLNTSQAGRNVEAEVRGAVAVLVAAQAALAQAQEAVKAARVNVDETEILYHQGLAKAIELVDANDSRFVAEVNLSQAEYALAQAYLSARQAIGENPFDGELR
jgi:outer membrane protein TolC